MKKIIFVLLAFLITTIGIWTQEPYFYQQGEVKIINNHQDGFKIVIGEQTHQIDKQPRLITKTEITVKDINNDNKKDLIVKYLLPTNHIPINGMIIIADAKVVFDSKEKLKNDAYEYMEKIYRDYYLAVKASSYEPDPEFADYDPNKGFKFSEELYCYKTELKNSQVIIYIKFGESYEKGHIFTYGWNKSKKVYELMGIKNNTGTDNNANSKRSQAISYLVAEINDPDGYTSVRISNNSNSTVIEKINRGKVFAVIKSSNEWWKIITPNNKIGYIHSSRVYIKRKDAIGAGIINDPDGYTNLRSGPSTNHQVLEKIYENEVFIILSRGQWYKIITNTGKIGYIYSGKIKELNF